MFSYVTARLRFYSVASEPLCLENNSGLFWRAPQGTENVRNQNEMEREAKKYHTARTALLVRYVFLSISTAKVLL